MCPLFGKGTIEIDVKRQAWVRRRPKPAEAKEPKHNSWNRPKINLNPNGTPRPQYGSPPPIYPPEPERPAYGYDDRGRGRHDEHGLGYAQGSYGLPPPGYLPEPASSARGRDDEGRSRHDNRGLGHAQSTRSQRPSRLDFAEDELDGKSIHQPGISELDGRPTHGQRSGGLRHHGSTRGPSRGQRDGRGRSRAQSNAGHGQSRYDFTPPADRMTAQSSHRA